MKEDWSDVLIEFLSAGVRFLVVGAHALAVHGVPRATQDLDVWVEPTPENAAKVWSALIAFGAPLQELEITVEDFRRPETVVQIGLPPSRIDVMTGVSGVSDFGAAWEDRVVREVSGSPIPFLGRATLLVNKRASGRLKDLADVEALGEEV